LDKAFAVLAIETSTDTGSVALVTDSGVVECGRMDTPRAHGRDLMPLIDGLFSKAGFSKEQLDCVAVDLGPGSYTGLRVGIATAQGIGMGLGLSCAGFETTEVIAENVGADEEALGVLVDVRGGDVFYRVFNRGDGVWRPTGTGGVAPADSVISALPAGILLVGSGVVTYADLFKDTDFTLADGSLAEPYAESIIKLAIRASEEGRLCAPGDLQAIYPRASSAEISARRLTR